VVPLGPGELPMITREEILAAFTAGRCPDCGAFEGEVIEYTSLRWDSYAKCKLCLFTQRWANGDRLSDSRCVLSRPWRIGESYSDTL